MNPLLGDVLGFLHSGRQFQEISPEKHLGDEPRTVDFFFTDGGHERRVYECSRIEFLDWWAWTCNRIRDTANAFGSATAS